VNIFALHSPILPHMSCYDRPSHRVFMTFFYRKGWQVQFVEADLKTPLPRTFPVQKPIGLRCTFCGVGAEPSWALPERAAASASRGQVKNLAEKPFIRNMAARLDATTGSSSTTKTCEPERGYTWGLFRVFLRVRQLFSRVSVFLGLTRILFTIAHVSRSPTRRPSELL
jgi:hypothetical protein